jgi:sugar diacid utilization regulator
VRWHSTTWRETLHVFLASGSSPSRAAERLGVYRNTITYRLNAFQDIVANDHAPDADWATQAARRLKLELALRIVDQLGLAPPTRS